MHKNTHWTFQRFLAVVVIASNALRCVADITWESPSDGDVFGPGDAIIGKWSTDETIDSPSFKLCMSPNASQSQRVARDSGSDGGADSNCGSTVWPKVEQSAGSYVISL
jgi:hypothetical protein